MTHSSTLTHRFAAIQIKMWHIQFRMRQIYRNQKNLNSQSFTNKREKIKGMTPAIFSVIDMLISFEHLETLMGDILRTTELAGVLTNEERKNIGKTKNLTSRWIAVRNVFGGHIDIEVVEKVCVRHGFQGALLSDDLEADIAIYNCLLLEGAINHARQKSDLFGRDLDFGNNLSGEMKILVDKLNQDWNQAFKYFQPLMERVYEIGKSEKISVTTPEQRRGLITGLRD